MMKKPKEKLSLYKRSDYDVISETMTVHGLTAVIKVRSSGTIVICRIPSHTQDEDTKLSSELTYALMQLFFTGQDVSHIKSMEILSDMFP